MKQFYFILFLFTVSLSFPSQAQQPGNAKRSFYIVRHAEKDTGSNPAISTIGKKRSADLYKVLKYKKTDLIMVTNYRRTGMTGDSLRIYKDIDTVHYPADVSGDGFYKKLSSLPSRYKNIVVIGHSNTVPGIIRKAGVADYPVKDIPDNEYDNLFVVKRKKGKWILQSKKYGAPSPPATNNLKMNISQ